MWVIRCGAFSTKVKPSGAAARQAVSVFTVGIR